MLGSSYTLRGPYDEEVGETNSGQEPNCTKDSGESNDDNPFRITFLGLLVRKND